MIRSTLMICAEEAIVDRVTNSASLINLLEEFSAGGFPALHQKLCVFNILVRDTADPNFIVGVLRARLGDAQIFQGELRFDFEDKLRARHVTRIVGLVIPAAGVLTFTLNLGGADVATYSIPVSGPAAHIQGVVAGAA